jgi:hypothetical protein
MINTFVKEEIPWFHVFSKMKRISKTITNKGVMLVKQLAFYISSIEIDRSYAGKQWSVGEGATEEPLLRELSETHASCTTLRA